ncbi:DUF2090 domain-containing protein [Candidatus Daviesbacteria bacterium]|nr:DUF2090 domain-containing protein [Candidatus Daviesbacteria bacterium]
MNLSQFTSDGKFLMLALDHRGSFKKLMNPQDPESVSDDQAIQLKKEIIESLKDLFSGLLIDEVWGLDAYQVRSKPFLLPLEKTGYTDEQGERVTELEYTVEQIKNLGASGAKLLLYFNPKGISAKKQIETAKKVMQNCKHNDFPFFLEIVTYGSGKGEVYQSVKMLQDEGVVPDVWKLEYPGTEEGCKEITNLVHTIPWILLTGGQTFDQFKPELEQAIPAGAKGFLAGRALWQEVCSLQGEEKQKFLQVTLPERFKTISDIAKMS